MQADVANQKQVRRLFDTVQQRRPQLNMLVNNAGIATGGPLAAFAPGSTTSSSTSTSQGRCSVRIKPCHCFPPAVGESSTSTWIVAHLPIAGFGVYSATKAALESLTRVWAVELGPRQITVDAVAPG